MSEPVYRLIAVKAPNDFVHPYEKYQKPKVNEVMKSINESNVQVVSKDDPDNEYDQAYKRMMESGVKVHPVME